MGAVKWILFWTGAAGWLAIELFLVISLLPNADIEDPAMRLGVLLALPYLAVLLCWIVAIVLCAVQRSGAVIPAACLAMFVFHRYALIPLIRAASVNESLQ